MTNVRNALNELHTATLDGELTSYIFDELVKNPTFVRECEVLDVKRQLPDGDFEYAKAVRDLVSLHNSYGGFLIFGVREVVKDRELEIIGVDKDVLNVGQIRDTIRSYTGTDIRIKPIALAIENLHLEALWVVKRGLGERPVRFIKNGPEEKPGKLAFKKNDVVFRRIDNNAVAKEPEDYDFLFSERKPPSLELILKEADIGDPLEHNLPDRSVVCSNFVGRGEDVGDLWTWLADDFSRVRLIAGEGGLGKTSLAYHFSESLASRRVKPYTKVVWLTAKERQFIPSRDTYLDAAHIDFSDADSLFRAIAVSLGCLDNDFVGLDGKEIMQLALESCAILPSFIVVDDVDSLKPPDQLRALEFGMRTPPGTKMLLTTRVNFSYSPDNVLKLDGLPTQDFRDYVHVLRARYNLPVLTDNKIDRMREVTGGSPLFTDSVVRLERRGLPLDKAMADWKGEKGLEVRKAALLREVEQLSREAKRILFVISSLKNCSYAELAQVVDYTDQTLGDALQELSGLFLISAPSIAREARYTVEPNTGRLVLSLAPTLGIDHAALIAATKRSNADAIGLGIQKRSNLVGLAINDAIATLKHGDSKGALEIILFASKKLNKPHPDLLLALGRFSLKLQQPNYDDARKAFEESYALGQRKPLIFELWFEAEYARSSFEAAGDVALKAIEYGLDQPAWYERSAEIHVALARRASSRISNDGAIRHIDSAISDLKNAEKLSFGPIQQRRLNFLVQQAMNLKRQLDKR